MSTLCNLRSADAGWFVLISAKIVQFLYLIGMRSLIFYVFCSDVGVSGVVGRLVQLGHSRIGRKLQDHVMPALNTFDAMVEHRIIVQQQLMNGLEGCVIRWCVEHTNDVRI